MGSDSESSTLHLRIPRRVGGDRSSFKTPKCKSTGISNKLAAYARCTEQYGKLHSWVAFLDGDEFLETPGNETRRNILEGFKGGDAVGALAVNGKMHSSSGLLTRPEAMRKSFVRRVWDDLDNWRKTSDNRHMKVVVRTD